MFSTPSDNCIPICPYFRQRSLYLLLNWKSLKLVYQVKGKPFPKQQILGSSELREFADDNFKFDENGRKLSERVENTEGKGEIAHYEQFLLFPQCFQTICTADT